jgi:cytochrome c biogenesis protein CcdA
MIEFILAVLHLIGFILLLSIPFFLIGLGLDISINGQTRLDKRRMIHHFKVFFGGFIIVIGLLVGMATIKNWFTDKKD